MPLQGGGRIASTSSRVRRAEGRCEDGAYIAAKRVVLLTETLAAELAREEHQRQLRPADDRSSRLRTAPRCRKRQILAPAVVAPRISAKRDRVSRIRRGGARSTALPCQCTGLQLGDPNERPELDAARCGIGGGSTRARRRRRPRFHANDNIAEFIEQDELKDLEDEVTAQLQGLLGGAGDRYANDHNTCAAPPAVARMFRSEAFRGRYHPMPAVTEFPNAERLNELMIIGPITGRSAVLAITWCPILGACGSASCRASNRTWIGLSKYCVPPTGSRADRRSRKAVDPARRPCFESRLRPGTASRSSLEADHYCTQWRGVKGRNAHDEQRDARRGALVRPRTPRFLPAGLPRLSMSAVPTAELAAQRRSKRAGVARTSRPAASGPVECASTRRRAAAVSTDAAPPPVPSRRASIHGACRAIAGSSLRLDEHGFEFHAPCHWLLANFARCRRGRARPLPSHRARACVQSSGALEVSGVPTTTRASAARAPDCQAAKRACGRAVGPQVHNGGFHPSAPPGHQREGSSSRRVAPRPPVRPARSRTRHPRLADRWPPVQDNSPSRAARLQSSVVLADSDLVGTTVTISARTTLERTPRHTRPEFHSVRHNPAHQWFCMSDARGAERVPAAPALLRGSRADGRARYPPRRPVSQSRLARQSSRPRESIEARTLCRLRRKIGRRIRARIDGAFVAFGLAPGDLSPAAGVARAGPPADARLSPAGQRRFRASTTINNTRVEASSLAEGARPAGQLAVEKPSPGAGPESRAPRADRQVAQRRQHRSALVSNNHVISPERLLGRCRSARSRTSRRIGSVIGTTRS